jgi:hypothetical protein
MAERKFTGLKSIFLALLIGAFVCFTMGGNKLKLTITRLAHRAAAVEKRIARRPSPFREPSPEERARAAQEAAFRSVAYLAGVWEGSGASSREQGMCSEKLEIRARPENQFSGYVTLTCIPLAPWRMGNAVSVLLQRSPHSSILTGVPANRGIAFSVDKNIGAGECPITTLTALPFGAAQLAVEWKSSKCSGGQMVLNRIGQ